MLGSARGFTLIEVMVVIALFSVLLGLGLLLSMDVYRGALQRSARSTLIDALSLARARSLANQRTDAHGVCFDPPNLVSFTGSSYKAGAPENEITPLGAQVGIASENDTFSCERGGVIFAPLSAMTSGTVITLTEEGRPDATITVNHEGAIMW